MGGGGGGRYTGPTSDALRRMIDQAKERERQRLDTDVNDLLQKLLAHFNDRDTEVISDRLVSIGEMLSDVAEIETFLLGGSVGKHTAVNGISDVDALVILGRPDLAGKSPQFVLNSFHKQLNQSLPRSEVKSVEKGRLAVTVTYHDGTEIQLLPALRSGQTISIASADGKNWIDTKPKVFQRELTRANRQLNQALIPTIKLLKSIVSDFPKQKQLTGYHIEAMALDAARDYQGPKTSKWLLLHLLGYAADRVLKPMADITGQSRNVDSYLGKANSVERRNISQALAGMKRRLEAATTVSQWRAVFEG
jgi:Second Messenger Oligonucleotide or Dinucleotide Synthetase domain